MKYLHYVFLLIAFVLLAVRHLAEMQSNSILYIALFLLVLTVVTPIVINYINNRKG